MDANTKPLVLINRGGGSAGNDSVKRVREALRAIGVDADIKAVSGSQCAKHAAAAVKNGTKLVVAAGGDGTMSAVAGALCAATPRAFRKRPWRA